MDIDTNGRGIAQIDNSEPPTCECCGDVYTMETGDEPTPFCDRCAHDVLEKQTAELTEARATIATLTHRAEVAEQSAALWRERCNKAEQKVDDLRAKLARAEGVVEAAHHITRCHDMSCTGSPCTCGLDTLISALATYEEG